MSTQAEVLYGGEDCTIRAVVNGENVTETMLSQWIKKRIRKVEKKLALSPMKDAKADSMLQKITEEKLSMGQDAIHKKIDRQLSCCTMLTKMAVRLSRGKRRFAIADLYIAGLDLGVFLDRYNNLQSVNSEENLAANIGVAPDHYYMGVNAQGDFEVIETCGNLIVPADFMISYNDEKGLRSKRDAAYPEQSAGTAFTRDGVPEGGVRHQFQPTADGFHARLLVEFPSVMPEGVVRNHEMHLCCEFSHWVRYIARGAAAHSQIQK